MNIKTKAYVLFSLSLLIILGSLLTYLSIVQKNSKKNLQAKNKVHVLIGLQNVLSDFQQTIIILFSPDCEHCQYEAKEIRKHIKEFGDTKILMISSDDSLSIKKFANYYQLNALANVQFLYLPKEKIFETFASASVPRILIYNREGNLVKDFKGEIKIEKLLKYVER